MTLIHRLASVIRWLTRRDQAEHDLNEEMQAFVELSAAEKVRDGILPAQARRLAVLELGGVEQTKERVRTGRHGAWVDEVGRDVRYAFRMFASHSGFTAVIVLTLALGIGANTAIFSLIDALMLRWLPVRNPQELVLVTLLSPGAKTPGQTFSYPIASALAEQREIFAGAAGFSSMAFDVGAPGTISRVSGAVVTGAYYETLGLTTAAGRLIARSDDTTGAPLVAVISHGFWSRQFAGSGAVVGQQLLLNGAPVTIIGVSPPGFAGTNVGQVADVTITVAAFPRISPQAGPLLTAGNFWLRVLARPREGVSIAGATARLNAMWSQTADGLIAPHWPASRRKEMAGSTFHLAPGGTGWTFLRQMYVRPLFVLMAMVALVLLIACANVATLLLARASVRQREIAVRLAIGAGRSRIVRQLLVESTLLSLMGAACGIGLAWMSGRFLVSLIAGGPMPIVFDMTPNWHILAFTTAVAIATSVIFGVAPALQATAVASGFSRISGLPKGGHHVPGDGLSARLKDDARMTSSKSRTLPSLVSVQVALSLVLLVGAALFVRTLRNLQQFDPGFKADGVLLVDLQANRTALPPDLLDDLSRVPGVVAASVSTHTPLSGSIWSEPAVPVGQTLPERDTAIFVGAGPQFFSTMGIPVLAGRDFTDRDGASTAGVAVVNERYAQRFFANRNPVGEHLTAIVRNQKRDLEIVGLARDTRIASLRANPPATVYVAYSQLSGDFPTTIAIRAAGALGQTAAAIRDAVQARLPSTMVEVRPLSAQVGATMVQERMMATLAAGFGLLALTLAAVGLYGVLAYTVARRTREIGIRMALGAQRRRVVGLVLTGAARLVVAGIVLGLPAAWAASRWVESMLFGLKATDPTAIVGAVVLLAGVAQLAAYVPAWRASHVDPLTALRHE
jgi:putative ABC transport system permease protein